MVTVYRANGLRIVIFVDDHEPSHVHVSAAGMTRADLRRALRIVSEQRAYLLEQWSRIHG